MKLIIVALAIIALANARPESEKEPIAIVKYENEGVNADGSYQWSLETANGIVAEEQGSLKEATKDAEAAEQVQGSYKYTGEDGVAVELHYVADENGFQPQGEHLPVAPPVPEIIQRSLEYNAAHPQPEEKPKA